VSDDQVDETAKAIVVYDFEPKNLPTDYLAAIGLVVANASQTDNIMRDFIGALLGVDNIETIALGTHMSTPMKDDIIRSLAELSAPCASEIDQIDDILDRIRSAIARRNEVAHNAFAIHPTTGEIFSMRERARGSLQVDFRPIKVEELLSIADDVYKAGIALMQFMVDRKLGSRFRTKPLFKPLNRKTKARAERRQKYGAVY
jgi:hypothetical protein